MRWWFALVSAWTASVVQFAVHDEEQMARTDRATGRPFSGGPLAVPVRPEEPPPQSPVPVASEDSQPPTLASSAWPTAVLLVTVWLWAEEPPMIF